MRLRAVQINEERDLRYLFSLLAEREPHESISHRKMPTWVEHCQFVAQSPTLYEYWFIIETDDAWVGSIYFTKQREIGIHMRPQFRKKGYGSEAIQKLIDFTTVAKSAGDPFARHQYLVNINPDNGQSIALFTKLGFKTIQLTMRRDG